MKQNKTTYIIFGASGDLSKRYLLPALRNVQAKFEINVIPISRKDYHHLSHIINVSGEKIFHLAIPPEAVPEAIELIKSNINGENAKIILEKPFGKDLESARTLVKHVEKYLPGGQIYRVDHYLAKNSVQEILNQDWVRENVMSIEILASEEIDIEGRINFYEKTGALQDFVQSHLLMLAALTFMKKEGVYSPRLRYEALRNLEVVCQITKHECVKRGQYEGYREEVGNKNSMVETFVSINMISNDPAWRGVPITLTTGKALKEKITEVRINYKDGGIKIFKIDHEPDAYERVISAAISGDSSLFISSEEVLESWRILDAIQQTWKNSKDDLIIYPKGCEARDIK